MKKLSYGIDLISSRVRTIFSSSVFLGLLQLFFKAKDIDIYGTTVKHAIVRNREFDQHFLKKYVLVKIK